MMSGIEARTDFLVHEISNQLSNISVMQESFSKDVNRIITSIENKSDLGSAMKSLCMLVQSINEGISTLYQQSQHTLIEMISIQKDLDLSNFRRDIFISENSERIQKNETKIGCTSDLCKVWIRFSCEKELNEIKNSKNLIGDVKVILKKMNINIDDFGINPIRSAFLQHIKVESSIETVLGINFTNDCIAGIIRKKIIRYKTQVEKQANKSSYSHKIYWSKNVWKLLKVCYELRRLKLVSSVFVNNDGIRVKYSTANNGDKMKTHSTIVTCYQDIDRIRSAVGDIHADCSCNLLYDDDYFKLKFSERDLKRSSDYPFDSDDDDEPTQMD